MLSISRPLSSTRIIVIAPSAASVLDTERAAPHIVRGRTAADTGAAVHPPDTFLVVIDSPDRMVDMLPPVAEEAAGPMVDNMAAAGLMADSMVADKAAVVGTVVAVCLLP